MMSNEDSATTPHLRPATEADLQVPIDHDHSPMKASTQEAVGTRVLVGGQAATAMVGTLGGWSTRIVLQFDNDLNLPEGMTQDFATKHFHFTEPGRLAWGHEGRTVEVLILDD
jgi:hypothetical protein